MAGLWVSVRLERVPVSLALSVSRDIELSRNVYQKLACSESDATTPLPSTTFLHLVQFGAMDVDSLMVGGGGSAGLVNDTSVIHSSLAHTGRFLGELWRMNRVIACIQVN